jgi:hypothetical protein
MVFTVISFAPEMTAGQRARAEAGAPPFTESLAPYPDLLNEAYWELEEQIDVTAAFCEISRRELDAFVARSGRLREQLGEPEFSERLALRRAKVAGIEEGLIRRYLFVAHTGPIAG